VDPGDPDPASDPDPEHWFLLAFIYNLFRMIPVSAVSPSSGKHSSVASSSFSKVSKHKIE
jgi:hypothetical protein